MSKTKDSKEFFYGSNNNNGNETLTFKNICHILRNKYYNIYRSNFKCDGLDYRQEQFVMNKFWDDGTIAAFKIKFSEDPETGKPELGFAPWVRASWDMYNEPETVNLVNIYGASTIPSTTQIVDKDVVIGYIQSNRKPLKLIVNWYIERIAQCQMILNTNLHMQAMPFLIPVSEKDERSKLEDVVKRILNNEMVICVDGVDPHAFASIATNVPYIVDKLQNYKKDLEDDLLTYLGVNNNGSNNKQQQEQLAAINSNNEEINLSDTDFNNQLKAFCDRVNKAFGVKINIYVCGNDVVNDGQEHQNGDKPGPKDDESEE